MIVGQEIADPQRASGMAFLANAAFGAAFGLLSPISAGYFDQFDKATLTHDLTELRDCCDAIGIALKNGAVFLRLAVDGDGLSGESLIGRCALIHERTGSFRKYAMSIVKTWFHDVRNITVSEVYLVFSTHKAAKDFKDNCANKCAHYTYKKQLYTAAFVVDLEGREIVLFKTRMTPILRIPNNLFAETV